MVIKRFHTFIQFTIIVFLIGSISCGLIGCAKGKSYILVKDGSSPYIIVVASQASPSEKHAAEELQSFIKQATKAELSMIEEKESIPKGSPCIYIGLGDLSQKVLSTGKAVDWKKLGDEGFIIRTVPEKGSSPDIVIAGSRLRGTMYGVYAFLDSLGFKWYTNSKTWFPEGPTLRFSPFDEEIIPPFMYRDPYFAEMKDQDFAARNRLNTSSLDDVHGGSMRVVGVHTFDQFIPPSLFNEHPEYFPLIGGKRVTGYVQRCLTNPDVVKIAAKNMIKWINESPKDKIFSLSQSDVYGKLCECPNCKKVIEEEGAPSGLYLRFVNQVAEIVEKTHPDKYIETLAYHFTEVPPKTEKPRNNVIIRLAPIQICCAHPFTECTEEPSVKLRENIKGWHSLTDRIFIWCYITDFYYYLMPFPDFKEITADIKNYYENGVRGIFFEGSMATRGMPDNDLRAWVFSRLLWNPYENPDALVNEWMKAVYGKAFQPMRAYYDLIHEQVKAPDRHMHIFDPPTKEWWPDHVVASMESLYQSALTLAQGDSTATYFVKKNYMGVMLLKYILNTGRLEVADGSYSPVGNTATLDEFDKFIDYTKQFDVSMIGHTWTDIPLSTMLRQRLENHPVVMLENPDVRLEIVPNMGGRIISFVHKKTGTNLVNRFGPTMNFYPSCGGYEEHIGGFSEDTGFANPYSAEVKGKTVTLTANTKSKFTFKRTISLPERGSVVTFSSSIINENDTPRTYQVICRMNFDSNPSPIVMKARAKDGSFAEPAVSENRVRRGTVINRYEGDNKPRGVWSMQNLTHNLTVENRFQDNEVETCITSSSEKTNLAQMEIQSPVREISPKGKITINHVWEIKEGN